MLDRPFQTFGVVDLPGGGDTHFTYVDPNHPGFNPEGHPGWHETTRLPGRLDEGGVTIHTDIRISTDGRLDLDTRF